MTLDFPLDYIDRFRQALAPFTVAAAYELLGPHAHGALLRNETTPALRASAGRSPVAVLLQLFSLQCAVPLDDACRALPDLIEPLQRAGIIAVAGDAVRARIDIRPYGDENHDWWLACDLTPQLDGKSIAGYEGGMAPDHVLGISQASSSLAGLTVPTPVGSALDLGTGCGVQSLHLAQRSGHVVATDVNERALAMARLNARLNNIDLDVRAGSLFEPVCDTQFDLIVTNPPFVISPPGSTQLVYRDSGMPGDDVVKKIVTGANSHLTDGGWCQILANWIHSSDQPWQDRLRSWIAPTGLDALVIQREIADPASYVEIWLADAGLHGTAQYVELYDAWLSWFDREGISAVGFGWINLRKSGRLDPHIEIEHWPGPIAGPVGDDIVQWAGSVDVLAGLWDLLDEHWQVCAGVVEETVGAVGAEDPQTITVRRLSGMCKTRQLSTLEAGFLSACDGQLSAGQISSALAELLDLDELAVHTQVRQAIDEMARDGFIERRQ